MFHDYIPMFDGDIFLLSMVEPTFLIFKHCLVLKCMLCTDNFAKLC